jgi:hypothetical protein
MANKILFGDNGNGPVQEDEVNEKQTVKFYCNVDFSIIFESRLKDKHLESSSKTRLTAPNRKNQDVVFPADPHEGGYRVKIKFRDVPEEGFKYIVRTANGDLDPRVVPPR